MTATTINDDDDGDDDDANDDNDGDDADNGNDDDSQMKVPETMDRTLEEISAEASHGAHGVDTATALGLAPVAAPGTSDAL